MAQSWLFLLKDAGKLRLFAVLVTFMILWGGVTSNDENASEVCKNPDDCQPSSKCGYYMAESTIPHAGLGVFTTKDRQINDTIGNGDVLFPIVDLWYHLKALRIGNLENLTHVVVDPTQSYIWFGPEMGMQHETAHPYVSTEYVSAFAPGLDAVINCHIGLINVEKQVPRYDTAGLHRARDPGAGAITPYHQCRTYASHFIPAGSELFKFYGDNWFETRPDLFSHIPLSWSYPRAEKLASRFHRLGLNTLPSPIREDLWNLVLKSWSGRTMNALPRTIEDVELVAKDGIRALYQPSAIRPEQDLEEHGRCIDHIQYGPSTLPQAGRGAFAKRFLKKGTVVTGTPLLIVASDYFFKMYRGDWLRKNDIPDKDDVVSFQILYNYCFHHEQSSVFLCPYGSGIHYINHNKSLANIGLQWAVDGVMGHRSDVLRQHPESLKKKASPGIFLDYVATRDILPGEELFMDYGDAWEAAWNRHVAEWNRDGHDWSDYISARDWNIINADAVIRTELEQILDPYPPHFELRCLDEIKHGYLTPEDARSLWGIDVPGNPCKILEHGVAEGTNEILYRVRFTSLDLENVEENKMNPSDDDLEWEDSDWIERQALRFVDKPYTTDLYLSGVFRQPIGLPDDLLPDAWRNVFLEMP